MRKQKLPSGVGALSLRGSIIHPVHSFHAFDLLSERRGGLIAQFCQLQMGWRGSRFALSLPPALLNARMDRSLFPIPPLFRCSGGSGREQRSVRQLRQIANVIDDNLNEKQEQAAGQTQFKPRGGRYHAPCPSRNLKTTNFLHTFKQGIQRRVLPFIITGTLCLVLFPFSSHP